MEWKFNDLQFNDYFEKNQFKRILHVLWMQKNVDVVSERFDKIIKTLHKKTHHDTFIVYYIGMNSI